MLDTTIFTIKKAHEINKPLFEKEIKKLNSPDTFYLFQKCEETAEIDIINSAIELIIKNPAEVSKRYYEAIRVYSLLRIIDLPETRKALLKELSDE